MREMLKALREQNNTAYTEKGAKVFKSTNNELLDFFSKAGAMRDASLSDKITLFLEAYKFDKLKAVKALFYFRDIRGGQGERQLFRDLYKVLAEDCPEVALKNLKLIPEFGRWDDIFAVWDTPLRNEVVKIVKEQLYKDMSEGTTPSLLAKWLPSINTSNKEKRRIGRELAHLLGMSYKQYRKTLSVLRKYIGIVETKLTNKEYNEIDYSKLPSRASMIYRSAFSRNDSDRYFDFIDKLSKGQVKINADTLYPHEIVSHVLYNTIDDKLAEGIWNNLPDYLEGITENAIVMSDVSGSMVGTPLQVSIALGLYCAERLQGEFNGYFMTFSESPQLQKVKGRTFREKVNNLNRADWGTTTDFESALNTILSAAIKNKVAKENMPKYLIVVSDMQFNESTRGNKKNFMKQMNKNYKESGYKMPIIVFWDVAARMDQTPITNKEGYMLVSGFSPSLFKSILTLKFDFIPPTPEELMESILSNERYSEITV